MYRFILIFLAFALAFSIHTLFAQDREPVEPEEPAGKASGETVTWEPSFDAALKKAKEKKCMIMMYFHRVQPKSEMCESFEKYCINQKAVVELAKNFICLKVDVKKDIATAKKFKVTGVPQTMFLDSEQKKLGRVPEFVDPEPFAKIVKEVYDSIDIEKKAREALKKDAEDLDANLKLGRIYVLRENLPMAEHHLKKVVDGDASNKKGYLVDAAFELGSVQFDNSKLKEAKQNLDKVRKNDPDNKKGYADDILLMETEMAMSDNDFNGALDKMNEFVRSHKKSEHMHRILFLMGWTYQQLKDIDKAIMVWEKLVKDFPDSPGAQRVKYVIPQLKEQLRKSGK
jgi:thioredoxin-related protein